VKHLAGLPRHAQEAIRDRVDSLADNPRPPSCKHLKGADLYRVRAGDYRVIYQIQDNILLVLVVKIGHRREVYRRAGEL
jgi:mRNA interferase RelE/StbE